MGPRKDEGSYLGYEEQGNEQLQNVEVFSLPQTTLQPYVKDRQKSSSEAIKTKLGRKQVLSCEAESDLAEHCLLMERNFFGLTVAEAMRLA